MDNVVYISPMFECEGYPIEKKPNCKDCIKFNECKKDSVIHCTYERRKINGKENHSRKSN